VLKKNKLDWVVDGGVVVGRKKKPFKKLKTVHEDGVTIVKPKQSVNFNRKSLWDTKPYQVDSLVKDAAKTLLKIKIPKYDGTLDVCYYNYFNNYELRNKIKKSHPHFSLVDLNRYLKSEWQTMTLEMKKEWLDKKNTKLPSIEILRPRADYVELVDKTPSSPELDKTVPIFIEVNKTVPIGSLKSSFRKWSSVSEKEKSVRLIQKWVRNYFKKRNYLKPQTVKLSPKELVGSEVYCKDNEKKGKIVSLYRRKGKQLRYRIVFLEGDSKGSLFYRKNFITL
jgi:hypothetical protein